MSDITIEDKKLTTIEFRLSFPKIEKAESYEGGVPKFGITMLFSKKADLGKMRKASDNAAIEAWGADKNKWPKLRSPFRSGSIEKPDMPGYKGKIFVGATSKTKPGVVDVDKNDILDLSEVYAGCYCRATLIAFAYGTDKKSKMKPGTSFALQNIQKLRDGKKFGGKRDAKDDFDDDAASGDKGDGYDAALGY